MHIRLDDLTGPEIVNLIREHLHQMHVITPPESVHALGLEKLRQPDITFWSVWDGAELMGCGALKELDPKHGEIKSMRSVTAHLRRGVASAMLRHIVEEARKRGYERVSLETGAMPEFEPARQMYARFGFVGCGPFGDYGPDPNSVFMTLEL